MSKSATQLASKLLAGPPRGLEDLRIHQFPDDASAHDDAQTDQLYADFTAEFEQVQNELTEQYGAPIRTGQTDNELFPLNGVFHFAIWPIGDRQLFAAVAHEDRGLPILLLLGTI